MPHDLECDVASDYESCRSIGSAAQVIGSDVETGQVRSIWVTHQCEWRPWTDGDDGWNATDHTDVYGCFLQIPEPDSSSGEGGQDEHGDQHALFTLSLAQFILIILSVLYVRAVPCA